MSSRVCLRDAVLLLLTCLAWLPAPVAVAWPPDAAPIQDAPSEPEAVPAADLGPASERVREGRYDEARDLLAALQADHPDDPSLLLMHGEVLLTLGRPTEALSLLQHCAELAPDRARVQFQLASALAATGDQAGAIEAFAREIELTEDSEVQRMCRMNRSVLLQGMGRHAEAAAELEAAMALKFDVNGFGDVALLYIEAGDLDRAESTLSTGAQAGFLSAEHEHTLGAARYRAGSYGKALAAFERAVALDPALADARRSLAATLDRLGRQEEALAQLRQYLKLRPDAPDSKEIQARIRAAGGG